MLSILCVRLKIKVKVGIPESFKVGWYPPKKLGRVTLSPFLEENRLLPQSQFGFRLKRSTTTALIAYTHQVLESMNKGCVTGRVFLDFLKAFDTVDHLLLINKLKSLGVAGKGLEWFRSYLSGRVEQTMCVNALSPPAKSPWEYHKAAFWDHCYSWCILMAFNLNCSTQR